MNCEHFEELISLTLDGEATRRESEGLRVHLQSCRRCRGYYAALLAVTEAADSDLAAPPKELRANIMARIAQEPTPVTVLPAQKRRRRAARYGALAASLLIIAGLGALAGGRRSSAEAPMMMAAPAAAEAEAEESAEIPAETAEDTAVNGGAVLFSAPAAAAGDTENAKHDEPVGGENGDGKEDVRESAAAPLPPEPAAAEAEEPRKAAAENAPKLFTAPAAAAPVPEPAAAEPEESGDEAAEPEESGDAAAEPEESGDEAAAANGEDETNGSLLPELAAGRYLKASCPELYEKLDRERAPVVMSATPLADAGEDARGRWSVVFTLTDGTVTVYVEESGTLSELAGEYLRENRPELYEKLDREQSPLAVSAVPFADGEENAAGRRGVIFRLTDGAVLVLVDENGDICVVTEE